MIRSSASTRKSDATDVVGIFPDDQSLIRLAGMLCIEQNDEWLVGRRYLSAESISLVIAGRDDHPIKDIKKEVRELQPAEPPTSSPAIEHQALTPRPGT